jgi:hypothetical protein
MALRRGLQSATNLRRVASEEVINVVDEDCNGAA